MMAGATRAETMAIAGKLMPTYEYTMAPFAKFSNKAKRCHGKADWHMPVLVGSMLGMIHLLGAPVLYSPTMVQCCTVVCGLRG
jgi:hypothetical protein